MTLSDKEILELNELCSAVIDETLSDQQHARLAHLLSTSDEARQFYIRATGLSASLFYYAGEMQTGAADANLKHHAFKPFAWITSAITLAASIALVFWLTSSHSNITLADSPPLGVARLTGSKDCQWANYALATGSRIEQGQSLQLNAGFAEITFDSGAKVLLQGPATLLTNSAWSATLTRGALKATVPSQAVGFSVSNNTVKVVDFGTEFVMSAGAATDLLVLKGQVEATPRTSADQQALVLNANESRRFDASGINPMPETAFDLDKWAHPVPLDRVISPTSYAHWSFDDLADNHFSSDAVGLSSNPAAGEIRNPPDPATSAYHIPGHWKDALQFNGHLYARIPLPTISENIPHTVAFWVKIPKDASLSNAYAMLAWNPNHKTLGFHPIHISWNRSPDDGVVGVLRTDYGRGFAIGETPLRDNRWHFITVVFIPPDNPKNFMEVKQYVDGHLEGEGNLSPSGSDVFDSTNDVTPASAGSLWLGCRLGINTVRTERFRGALDELFVVDRPLEPQEIVHLMTTNQL